MRLLFFLELGLIFYQNVRGNFPFLFSSHNQGVMKIRQEVDVQRERYLDLLIATLTGYVYNTPSLQVGAYAPAEDLVKVNFSKVHREKGLDWPAIGITMIGTDALKSLQGMLETVVRKNITGDFLEAGVWRGGASIFAKAVLRSYGEDKIRKVWVCDSFEGLPKNRTNNDGPGWSKMEALRVSENAVAQNFRNFDLFDGNVKFVKGYFVNSLPKIRDDITELAVLRMDGDMYESTMDILFNLYEKVTIGGFVIIDDYLIGSCRKAITEFRAMHKITEKILPIWKDSIRMYWVKERHQSLQHDWYKKHLAT